MLLFSSQIPSPPIDNLLVDVADDVTLDEGQLVSLLGGVVVPGLKIFKNCFQRKICFISSYYTTRNL
jgi:hypothetical protein